MVAALTRCPDDLKYAPAHLQEDLDVVRAATERQWRAWRHASEVLRGDRDVMLPVLQSKGDALEFVSSDLQRDRELALAALSNSGSALRYLPLELQRDRELLVAAVSNNSAALQFVADEHKDVELVRQAVSSCGATIRFAPIHLRDDPEMVALALRQSDAGYRRFFQEEAATGTVPWFFFSHAIDCISADAALEALNARPRLSCFALRHLSDLDFVLRFAELHPEIVGDPLVPIPFRQRDLALVLLEWNRGPLLRIFSIPPISSELQEELIIAHDMGRWSLQVHNLLSRAFLATFLIAPLALALGPSTPCALVATTLPLLYVGLVIQHGSPVKRAWFLDFLSLNLLQLSSFVRLLSPLSGLDIDHASTPPCLLLLSLVAIMIKLLWASARRPWLEVLHGAAVWVACLGCCALPWPWQISFRPWLADAREVTWLIGPLCADLFRRSSAFDFQYMANHSKPMACLTLCALLAHSSLGPVGLEVYGPLVWLGLLGLNMSLVPGSKVDPLVAMAALVVSTGASLSARLGLEVHTFWLFHLKWLSLALSLKALRSPPTWSEPFFAPERRHKLERPCTAITGLLLLSSMFFRWGPAAQVDSALHALGGGQLPHSKLWEQVLLGLLAVSVLTVLRLCYVLKIDGFMRLARKGRLDSFWGFY